MPKCESVVIDMGNDDICHHEPVVKLESLELKADVRPRSPPTVAALKEQIKIMRQIQIDKEKAQHRRMEQQSPTLLKISTESPSIVEPISSRTIDELRAQIHDRLDAIYTATSKKQTGSQQLAARMVNHKDADSAKLYPKQVQSRMGDLCSIMKRVEDLDAGISATTTRYFELTSAYRVKSEQSAERVQNKSELQKECRQLLAMQTEQLSVFKEEVERRNQAINQQRANRGAKAKPSASDRDQAKDKARSKKSKETGPLRCLWRRVQDCWRRKVERPEESNKWVSFI